MLGKAKHNAPPIAQCNEAMGVCFEGIEEVKTTNG